MRQILVIADPQDCKQVAYAKALKMAALTSSKIHVAIFCHESLSALEDNDFTIDVPAVKEGLLSQRAEWWQDYLNHNPPAVEVSYEAVWDKYLHHWVIEHCKERHYDLIVKTGHRSEKVFYTPSDWQLFREASAPIYSVNAKLLKRNKVVLVAMDLAHQHEEKQRLNKQLLEQAFRLSVSTDAVLHCCYAIKIPTLIRDMDLIDIPAHTHKLEDKARQLCQPWLDEYNIDTQQLHIKEGPPWQVINDIANKLKAQCIVIGTMGRKGVPGKLIGNTAEKVIHHAKSDLLVIKPE